MEMGTELINSCFLSSLAACLAVSSGGMRVRARLCVCNRRKMSVHRKKKYFYFRHWLHVYYLFVLVISRRQAAKRGNSGKLMILLLIFVPFPFPSTHMHTRSHNTNVKHHRRSWKGGVKNQPGKSITSEIDYLFDLIAMGLARDVAHGNNFHTRFHSVSKFHYGHTIN